MIDTPTPRTDEQINGKPCTQFGLLAGMSLRNSLVPSEFARQLERELAATQHLLHESLGREMEARSKTELLLKKLDACEDARDWVRSGGHTTLARCADIVREHYPNPFNQ